MNYDVFISYSHKDKQIADAVCARLEQEGIRCWYAPRDIVPGADWAESIIRSIESVKVMIIIFTDHSNASKQVLNEISNAVNAGVTIVPFRLTSEPPTRGIQYYFTAVHWLDAVDRPLKSSIEELCTRVKGMLALNGQAGSEQKETRTDSTGNPKKTADSGRTGKPRWLIPAILAVVLLVGSVAGLFLSGVLGGNKGKPEDGGIPSTDPPVVTAETRVSEPTEAPTQEPTAAPTTAPTAAPTAESAREATELPTVNPNNRSYMYKPEGTAVITSGSRTWAVPANGLFGLSNSGVSRKLVFRRSVEGLPELKKTRKIEIEAYGDGNEFHRMFHFGLEDGTTVDLDIQTSFSYLCFPSGNGTVIMPWAEIDAVTFDWEHACMADWPEYARFHLQDGTTVIVPAHTVIIGSHEKPAENQLSFNEYYNFPAKLKTARGYEADFSEIQAMAFGKGAYEENPDKWPEEIHPGWIADLPVSILFRDGRQLETSVAMDWLKFFALDEFGTFGVIPDELKYVDFVSDLAEEIQPPEVHDSAQNAK